MSAFGRVVHPRPVHLGEVDEIASCPAPSVEQLANTGSLQIVPSTELLVYATILFFTWLECSCRSVWRLFMGLTWRTGARLSRAYTSIVAGSFLLVTNETSGDNRRAARSQVHAVARTCPAQLRFGRMALGASAGGDACAPKIYDVPPRLKVAASCSRNWYPPPGLEPK